MKLRYLLIYGLMAAIAHNAFATEETTDPYEGRLLGDLYGERSKLAGVGVDVSVEYKADLMAIVSGGIKDGTNYLDNLDIKFALDGEKLFGLSGNKALVYFLNNDGGKPNAHRIGSTQAVDNIEVDTNTFKLYEAWDEQSFFGDKLSILAGLHDLNSEFDETDLTANFLKPAMQIGVSFSQSGLNGPSIFPTASLAARVKVKPTEQSYLMAGVFDGIPGALNDPRGTHIHLRSADGALLVAEAGLTPKAEDAADSEPNKFALGAWTYTKGMNDLVEVNSSGNPVKKRQAGAYLLSSYRVYHNKQTGHDIGLYLRGGAADGNTAQVGWDYETGIVGNGWVPSRSDSEIGLGLSQAHNDSKYLQSLGVAADRNEYSMELYYRDQLIKGISLQPDLQYVVNPGMDPAIGNATVIGMRMDINL